MPLVVIGLSHRTAPVELRERFAFPDSAIPGTLARLRESGHAEEAVILSTCNRVELYAAVASDDPPTRSALERFFTRDGEYSAQATTALYSFREPQSIEHLFKVACGLESMVLGETEILGQMKKAYDLALQHKHTGACLNKAFQKAFNVAKHIRTHTQIQRGSISIASVAVDLAERIFSSLAERTVMVLGAGDTSEKTAKALLSRGARNLLVSNRSSDRAVVLAQALGGRAVPFDHWASEFGGIDIIISSTAAPHYVLDRVKLEPLIKLRGSRALLLVDIAVPRDIEPEVNFLENVYLYNIDDLQSIADGYLKQRQDQISHCETIIRERVQALFSTPSRAALARADLCVDSGEH
jgi:glutamyl-tRNA reductase